MERAPKVLVLDASTAAKWFLKEEDTEKAVAIRDAHIDGGLSLVAPDLVVYEVANALNYNPKVSNADLEDYTRAFFDLDLDLVPPSPEYSSQATRAARRLSISVYDASYVALSDIVGTKLVTADKRLYGKIARTTRSFLLSDLGKTWTLTD